MTQEIAYDGALPVGADVRRFVNKVMDVLADGRRLKARLDSIAAGNDWVRLAEKLGLPNPGQVSDTQASDLWNIVSTAMSQIDAAQVRELSRLDQG